MDFQVILVLLIRGCYVDLMVLFEINIFCKLCTNLLCEDGGDVGIILLVFLSEAGDVSVVPYQL